MFKLDIDKVRELIKNGLSELKEEDSPEFRVAKSWLEPERYLEGDLEKRLSPSRQGRDMIGPDHDIHEEELRVLLEAYKSKQYRTYIEYITERYTAGPSFKASLNKKGCKCGLCGKDLLYFNEWTDSCQDIGMGEPENKHFLAYGTKTTDICLCMDCLFLAISFRTFLDKLDPGILNYQKRTPGGLIP